MQKREKTVYPLSMGKIFDRNLTLENSQTRVGTQEKSSKITRSLSQPPRQAADTEARKEARIGTWKSFRSVKPRY